MATDAPGAHDPIGAAARAGGAGAAQRVAGRAGPRVEILPLVDAILEDRTAHLFGAGGTNAALRLVEIDASLVERRSEEIEQAPARQNRTPVCHQFDIAAIIAGDVLGP